MLKICSFTLVKSSVDTCGSWCHKYPSSLEWFDNCHIELSDTLVSATSHNFTVPTRTTLVVLEQHCHSETRQCYLNWSSCPYRCIMSILTIHNNGILHVCFSLKHLNCFVHPQYTDWTIRRHNPSVSSSIIDTLGVSRIRQWGFPLGWH